MSEHDHEMLEVIACLNDSVDSQSWSTDYPLDQKSSGSKIKASYSMTINSPSFRAIPFVQSAMSLFACSSDSLQPPWAGDVIEYRTLFNISCTTSNGQYETVDAQSLGFLGSVAVFEEGHITAMDLATEIMCCLLRRDLNDSENLYYHAPVVSEINVNSDFIDFCFHIRQSVIHTLSGVQSNAIGYVLFMMDRQEIRVEKYSLLHHQEISPCI